MEKLAFTRACLPSVRVIMEIMHVLVVERLCQLVMGWIPALECLLPGVSRCAALSYHARHSMLLPFTTPALLAFPGVESPRVWLLEA
jgi:hypothetical protein